MTINGELGELKGLMIGLRDQYVFQRKDIGDIKNDVSDIKDALAVETQKRIAADAAIERKIPKPVTAGPDVEANTNWRHGVMGALKALGMYVGWTIAVVALVVKYVVAK